MFAGRDNPLVVGPARFETVSRLDKLAAALADKIAGCSVSHDWEVPVSPHLAETLAAGQRLWRAIEQSANRADPATLASLVHELFGPQSLQSARRAVGTNV